MSGTRTSFEAPRDDVWFALVAALRRLAIPVAWSDPGRRAMTFDAGWSWRASARPRVSATVVATGPGSSELQLSVGLPGGMRARLAGKDAQDAVARRLSLEVARELGLARDTLRIELVRPPAPPGRDART